MIGKRSLLGVCINITILRVACVSYSNNYVTLEIVLYPWLFLVRRYIAIWAHTDTVLNLGLC